jgi:two-component system, chemotaxis family, chemotaxis protein CheY
MAMTVMVVDDSATVRIHAGRALAQAGFTVIEAVDGIDALEKLAATTSIALIVCDVNMPRMSGVEFIEELAKRPAKMPPVIMLTTEGHPQLVQRAKASGAKGWMIKPFKPELLVAAARKLVAIAA